MLDFSPRASRSWAKPHKNNFAKPTSRREVIGRPFLNFFRNEALTRKRFSWQKRFVARSTGRAGSIVSRFLSSEPFEGGIIPSNTSQDARFSFNRQIKRAVATNGLIAKVAKSKTEAAYETLFRGRSADTSLYSRRFMRRSLGKHTRRYRSFLNRKKARWQLATRRPKFYFNGSTPLSYFRRRVSKLSGVWYLRRRRRVRAKFKEFLKRRHRTSKLGFWFNTTKVFSELKSVVCARYSDYTRKSLKLAKELTYRNFGSGLARALLSFGQLDFAEFQKGRSFYNNKAAMQPLSDYFVYGQRDNFLTTALLFPENRFEELQAQKVTAHPNNAFDLTLFESRTNFWESYIKTPTAHNSWLQTHLKVVANEVLVAPENYTKQFITFFSHLNHGLTFNSAKKKLHGAVKSNSFYNLRRRYFRKSWRVILRLKFERFIFNKVKFPVYVWFHNIWGLFFRRFYRWRRFEHKVVSRFVRARRRNRNKSIKIRVNWFKMLIRSLGLLGLVVGSVHCFTYVFSFLMVKFRKHWQVLKLIKRYLRRAVRVHKTITGIRVVVAGRFTGHMRARKNIFKIGGAIRYMNYFRRLTYVLFNSQTPWGVFGIRMWIQFKPRRIQFINEDREKILKKSYACKGLLKRKSLLRYSRQTLVELDNLGFGLKYYTNDDIDKHRHTEDLRINYAVKSAKIT